MRTAKKGFLQKTVFVLRKRPDFSIHAKPINKEKPFFSTAKFQFSTAPKLTCSYKFHPRKPCCELAVQQPFFETSQSCVSTKATLSHRFKSSPAIPRNLAIPGAAGYLMMAGYFRQNLESSGDLNRGRRTESRVLFGYFLHDAKSDNSFSLQRTSRFSKPRFSLLQWRFRTNKIKTFPKRASRFSKPRSSPPKHQLLTNKIKSFAAPRQLFPYFLLGTKSMEKKLFRLTAVSLPGQHTPCAFRCFLRCKKH